jgi:DNA-binding SARP family transcriptional activator/TolB-like protein
MQLRTFGRLSLAGDRPADDESPSTAQPKRLALLAYLALMSGRSPVRRDVLVALFWPELGDEEARRALRQALHYLRRVLGEEVLVGAGEELSVSPGRLRCDAVEFERLIAAGDPGSALSLYEGDFLSGFYLPDVAPELEEWVERTRGRLRRAAAAAAWSAAESACDADHALELGRRGCELEPDQEVGWRRLMLLQERMGDRSGALRTYDELEKRLRNEFEASPSSETAALAARLRSARPTSAPAVMTDVALAKPARSRRRWLAPLAVVLVVGAAAVAVRLSAERHEEPSLLATGAVAPRDRLLIADFSPTNGDTALAVAITEAFRIDLQQSPNVQVLTPRQVRVALQGLERPADVALDDTLAREVAVREGVKAFVVGRVSGIGSGYALTMELVGAESGEALTGVRETARDSSDLIDAVDRASERLRQRLGESLKDLRELTPLRQEMTASLPALRKYTEASRLAYGAERVRSIPLLQEAIALDSNFAMAHLSLAYLYSAIAEPGRAAESLRRAMAHRERLPFRDRQFLIGTDGQNRQDYDQAIRAYGDLLARYPSSAAAVNNMAIAYRDSRRLRAADSLWRRAIEMDSSIIQLYFGLHSAQILAGRFGDSRRTLDLIGRRVPDNPLLLTVEVQDASAQQDWETAERRAEANIASKRGDTLDLVDAFEQMAGIVTTQGRLDEAERYWRTQLIHSAASGSWGRRLFGAQQLGYLKLRLRADPAGALSVVDSALRRQPLDSILPGDRPYYELARFFAAAGDVPRPRQMMARAGSNDSLLGLGRRYDRAWTAGVIALAEGKAAAATQALGDAAAHHVCTICPLPDLARAYDAQGDAAAAIEAYERYLTTPWVFRYEVDAFELGFAMQRLGELYEAGGDARKAADVRGRLLALWRRADAELQPVLADVRTRVTAPGR